MTPATRPALAQASRKQTAIGSARKAAKAERLATGQNPKRATGIHHRKAAPQSRIHAKKDPPKRGRAPRAGQVTVSTPNVPGHAGSVDGEKYAAMKDILLAVLPAKPPGITQGEMFEAVRGRASRARFPGSTDRWWAKTVQLDLEAKGVLARTDGRPLRWHRA